MSLNYEQLEFKFEDGELHAPVSALYKKFIFEVLKESTSFQDELLYPLFITFLKGSINNSELFTKTPKAFQEEVYGLLEQPLSVMYEMIHKQPLPVKEKPIEKPKLTLVK